MNTRIKELVNSVKQLELEKEWLATQIFQKQHEIDQREYEIDQLNWRRESIQQMLFEDQAELAQLNEDVSR